jgi:hypothetical protein
LEYATLAEVPLESSAAAWTSAGVEGATVGLGVGVEVGVAVEVGVLVPVPTVLVAVAVIVGVGVLVPVGVAVLVGVGAEPLPARKATICIIHLPDPFSGAVAL